MVSLFHIFSRLPRWVSGFRAFLIWGYCQKSGGSVKRSLWSLVLGTEPFQPQIPPVAEIVQGLGGAMVSPIWDS